MSFLPKWQRLAPWTRSRVSLWRRARKLLSNLSAYCPVGALQINFQIQIQILCVSLSQTVREKNYAEFFFSNVFADKFSAFSLSRTLREKKAEH